MAIGNAVEQPHTREENDGWKTMRLADLRMLVSTAKWRQIGDFGRRESWCR
jgi:hypothetical protein